MDCQSIKINLLPEEPKRKVKTKSIGLAISVAIITMTMSAAGMFFIYSHIALACHGFINIVKTTNPGSSAQQFSFASTVSGSNSFSLSDGQTEQLAFAGEGNYTITENQINGWELTSIVCQTSFPYNVDLANRNVVVHANNDGNATCTFTNTKVAYCGDSYIDTGEQCDDGNTNNLDSCRNNCTLPTCGDGIQDSGELCDDGNTNNLDSCRNNCALPTCGDGIQDSGEQCDDHNNTSGDGCSSICTIEQLEPTCGDGHLDSGEQCDDGNNTSGDGCSATCAIEKGSLTICKYNDLNKNGVYDIASDTPLIWNIAVTYPGGSTTTVQTASTTGCYEMSNLPYGVYQIAEELKSGWVKSYPSENPTTATINASSTNLQITFLNYEPDDEPSYGSIKVCKLIDTDGLAFTTVDQYAATSSTWTFNLISASGTSTKITAIGDNCVTFSNLLAGNYQAQEEAQSGWQLIDPVNNNVIINLSSGENKTINFVNSQIVVPTAGSIAGYKYNDANNNGVIDSGEQAMSNWTIQLIACPYAPLATSAIQFLPNSIWQSISTSSEPIPGQCAIIATTTTDSTGHYQFTGLAASDYGIAELGQTNWTQTYPASSTFYYLYLDIGENKTNINFANYQPGEVPQPRCGDGKVDAGEQCDDGNNRNGDGCNSTCQTEHSGGGGGGGSISYFSIYNTVATQQNCNVVISWLTNYSATSRVYYDTEPHSTSTMPNKDYVYATINDASKITGHNVTVTGLKPNTTYYFRAYSEASSAQYSQEVSYKTGSNEQCGTSTVTVKGAEGKPQLAITKMVNTDFANPGQKDIEYLITVSNKGNLTAYGVKLKDLLPPGLYYKDVKGNQQSWDLGDLAPDTSKAVTYRVNVDANAKPQTYTNTATVTATNQDKPLSASAKLEVRAVVVLAATGFSLTEFLVMISALSALISLSIYLRRKSALN